MEKRLFYVGAILNEELNTKMLTSMEKFESKSAFLKKAILAQIQKRKNS